MSQHPAYDEIEPSALSDEFRTDIGPSEREIETSKAISLKRIADAIWGDDRNSGIRDAIFGIAERP